MHNSENERVVFLMHKTPFCLILEWPLLQKQIEIDFRIQKVLFFCQKFINLIKNRFGILWINGILE